MFFLRLLRMMCAFVRRATRIFACLYNSSTSAHVTCRLCTRFFSWGSLLSLLEISPGAHCSHRLYITARPLTSPLPRGLSPVPPQQYHRRLTMLRGLGPMRRHWMGWPHVLPGRSCVPRARRVVLPVSAFPPAKPPTTPPAFPNKNTLTRKQ